MDDEQRDRVIAKMTWFGVVSNKRRYRKAYDQEKIQQLIGVVHIMLLHVQSIIGIIHKMTVYTRGD